ncbi:ABC transporter ATP-binding protein [Symbiopectobacterium purcellii]|uniref:ABC transporter ATP-binding protein n=1 Tax=Symbiopectobacterium purcellii TaxID=2871826 RepID=UPI003F876A76
MLVTVPVGLMDAAIAWSLKPYMDVMMVSKATGYVLYLPVIIIIFGLLQGVLNYESAYMNTWVGQRISNDMKLVLYERLIKNSALFFDRETSGQVQLRFNHDVDSACNGLISNVKVLVTRVISSASLVCILIYNSWKLAIIAVIVLVGALYPLTRIRHKIKSLVDKAVFSGALISTYYNEAFNGNRIVTSYNLGEYQKKRFEKALHAVFRLGMKMTQKTGIVSPIMHFIVSIGIAVVIWLGSYLIVIGEITTGNFVSFLAALLMLYTPLKGIGNNFNAVQMAFMAMERVWNLLDTPQEITSKPNAVKLSNVNIGIEYRDVCFEYSPGKTVLKHVNLTMSVGKTIALVGNSGGGKSTFANLLPRFYDVSSGAILIDGIDIRDIDIESLRSKIGFVFQDNFLFIGTIRENILLGNEYATEEELQQAVKSACLDEFISTLDVGLDTEIGERGVLLSGGQRQRVGIARAFLKNAPIVILDEATSALDNKSEAIVQEAISNLMKDRTVFIIAHRLSTIRNADKILVLNQGEIVEQGNHEQLMKNENGVYASLYNLK